MKVCPECGRTYSDEAVVCAFDGTPLSTGSTTTWSPNNSTEPTAGDVLGQYRILEEVGRGGMGVIFKAEHVRLGRIVALKVLRSTMVKRGNIVQRFFTEARSVNEIGHPNIVDIYDFVEVVDTQSPLVYMVMEFLEGESLAERIERAGPLSPEEAQGVALQIVSALNATHAKRILHRDLKPQNVFVVATDDESLRVKVLDFGVSKAFGDRKAADLTQPGSAVGTPYYMAPEQILGKDADPRTDIYALGVMLYELLAGAVPFKAKNRADLLSMHVRLAPTPLRKHRPDIPPRLEKLVMTCLQKAPDHRYRDMNAVQHALERCLGRNGRLPATEAAARGTDRRKFLQRVVLFALIAATTFAVLAATDLLPEKLTQWTSSWATKWKLKPRSPATAGPGGRPRQPHAGSSSDDGLAPHARSAGGVSAANAATPDAGLLPVSAGKGQDNGKVDGQGNRRSDWRRNSAEAQDGSVTSPVAPAPGEANSAKSTTPQQGRDVSQGRTTRSKASKRVKQKQDHRRRSRSSRKNRRWQRRKKHSPETVDPFSL